MPNTSFTLLNSKLDELANTISGSLPYRQGSSLFQNGQCKKLSESEKHFEFSVDDKHADFFVAIDIDEEVASSCTCKSRQLCRHQIASYFQLHQLLNKDHASFPGSGIKYSREGMIKRVIDERRNKARQAAYTIDFSDNVFGEHLLTNEKGRQYYITFRDLKRKHGYCSCPDYQTNKLGTCKHLIFAFDKIASESSFSSEQIPAYPFIEIYLNPFRDYKISWFYPKKPSGEVAELLYRYFGNKNYIDDEMADGFIGFINNAVRYKQILIRPEVPQKVRRISERLSLSHLQTKAKVSYDEIKTDLLPFQKEGIKFATFKTGALIADEMGLGKNIQAIGTALLKKQFLGFQHALIISPASMIDQWVGEIEAFTNETVLNLDNTIDENKNHPSSEKPFFSILSYESLIANFDNIKNYPPDFLILDEAQRIVNYESLTFSILKSMSRKHVLALTGTPVQSKLIDLYSLMLLVDPDLLTPLWEFSYQHCYFDKDHSNKITGFYNLDQLNLKLRKVIIQRQKHEVIDELPSLSLYNIPVKMHYEQQKLHLVFATDALNQVSNKLITAYELQQLPGQIRNMRMLCSSTFLADNTTNHSPKLEELDHILNEKLDVTNSERKVVIFTEWKRMLNIISKMLEANKLPFVEITEDTTAENMTRLLKRFETDDECKILLTTEDASREIKLQIVDTVINFDVPMGNVQKNRRAGIIDPIKQRSSKITIINLMAENSIETWSMKETELEYLKFDKILFPNDQDTPVEISMEGQELLKQALFDLSEKLRAGSKQENPGRKSKNKSGQMKLDFSDEESDELIDPKVENQSTRKASRKKLDEKEAVDQKELKKALKSGVEFLSQLVKMSTGKSIELKGKNIDLNPKTGEITLKFKVNQVTP
jgi:hypothetical protein